MVFNFTQYSQLSFLLFPHNIKFYNFYKNSAFNLSYQIINVISDLTVNLSEGQQFIQQKKL